MDVILETGQYWDITLLRAIHHHRLTALDEVLCHFSFATTYVSVSLLLAVLGRSFFVESQDVKRSLRRKFFILLTVLLSGAVLSFGMKQVFERERPFARYADVQKLSEGGSPSFPSGHTVEAFAMAMACRRLFSKRRAAWLLFLWAVLVGYSRMALGVHYPLDVLGGACAGMLMSAGLIRLWGKSKKATTAYIKQM
jgi:undecaprenyl-diphosphatase